MKCRDVERELVLRSDEIPNGEVRKALRAHLEACPCCASIANEIERLRRAVPGSGGIPPVLPAALLEETRRLCHERIKAREANPVRPASRLNGAFRRIPPAVWATTAGLLLLTAFILVPFFGEVLLSEPLSYISWVGLGFVVQNVLMLLASPLLFRRVRGAEA